jgi:hypothetical protein
MFILHVTRHSLVRFTPARISAYWGRYTEHRGAAICLNRGGGKGVFKEPLNPDGIFYIQRHERQLGELIRKADVIHCHDDAYPIILIDKPNGKKLIYHAHIGDVPRRIFRSRRYAYSRYVKHACITNGYGRHFDVEERRANIVWGRLPDILDLDHPNYLPAYNLRSDPAKGLKVVFTFSNAREGGKINAKCPVATKKLLLNPIMPGIQFRFISGVSFEVSMHVKREAHIVLDEIFSPYTHLGALEGAAVGACVLTSYDDITVKELCGFVGAPVSSYPFMNVTPRTIRSVLEKLRANPKEVTERGRAARAWMETYYDHRSLLKRYLEFYHS